MRVETKKKYMSHIFYERYIGEIPAGMCMLHKCDTPACINPRHLFIGTKADNTYDMVGKGRNYIQPLGEKHPRASISNAIAKKIKIEYVPRKVPASYLAKKYGTTRAVVYDIIKGRSWKEAV